MLGRGIPDVTDCGHVGLNTIFLNPEVTKPKVDEQGASRTKAISQTENGLLNWLLWWATLERFVLHPSGANRIHVMKKAMLGIRPQGCAMPVVLYKLLGLNGLDGDFYPPVLLSTGCRVVAGNRLCLAVSLGDNTVGVHPVIYQQVLYRIGPPLRQFLV